MEIDAGTGWIRDVDRVLSPNRDQRPEGCCPELIVVHGISLPEGEFGGPHIDRLFTNQLDPADHPSFEEIHRLEVSAHVLIRRDGSLTQYVPFVERAWHAGRSQHCGRDRCNDFSIGIELEGADDVPYEPVQYQRLADLIAALREVYTEIAADSVVGHCDIAPGRKTDPGPAFDWQHLAELRSDASGPPPV